MVQVKDLIKALQKMPQNLDVCVEHTELDGFIGINNAFISFANNRTIFFCDLSI